MYKCNCKIKAGIDPGVEFVLFLFQMDLMPFVSKAGCECLNESDDCGFDNCLIKDSTYMESDCDEQVRAVQNLPKCVILQSHRRIIQSVHAFLTYVCNFSPVPNSCAKKNKQVGRMLAISFNHPIFNTKRVFNKPKASQILYVIAYGILFPQKVVLSVRD